MLDCYHASITLQTLFNKFSITYFEVEPTLANISNGDPLAHILQKYLPIVPGDFIFLLFMPLSNFSFLMASPPPNPAIHMADQEKEHTPFLCFMKWDEHLADVCVSKEKCALILQLKAPASPGESVLCKLGKVIDDYLDRGMVIGWNHNNHSGVRKHLAQGAVHSSNVNVIH